MGKNEVFLFFHQILGIEQISFTVEGAAIFKVHNIAVAILHHVDVVIGRVATGVGRGRHIGQQQQRMVGRQGFFIEVIHAGPQNLPRGQGF